MFKHTIHVCLHACVYIYRKYSSVKIMASEVRETPLTELCWAIDLNSLSITRFICKTEIIVATAQGITKIK